MRWLRQLLCRHAFYLDEIVRLNAEAVACPCFKCGKGCEATYGLALPGDLKQRPNATLGAGK